MNYEYIKALHNVNPTSSFGISLWKNRVTGMYYVSQDYKEQINNRNEANRYLLLYEEPKIEYTPYRSHLSTSAVQVTPIDFLNGVVKYHNSFFKLT